MSVLYFLKIKNEFIGTFCDDADSFVLEHVAVDVRNLNIIKLNLYFLRLIWSIENREDF